MAYTIDNNLYYADGDNQVQVTDNAENVVAGQSVHRNEFAIEGGIFWSADRSRLAFYRKDESKVTTFPLLDITTRTGSLREIKYPMAGMESHTVKVGVYNLKKKKTVYTITGFCEF